MARPNPFLEVVKSFGKSLAVEVFNTNIEIYEDTKDDQEETEKQYVTACEEFIETTLYDLRVEIELAAHKEYKRLLKEKYSTRKR